MNSLDIHTIELLRHPKKRACWIKYQLAIRGKTLTSLGEHLGVSRGAVALALHKPYPRMEKLIADELGLTPQVLFPERYDQDGLPNRPMGRPKKSISNTIKNQPKNRNVKERPAA